ncbi:hypothetical protein GRI43_01260 [Altererythrobacter luteolus]|uniref:Uncharacterized protein n=1 Tax=Pontixanthobacter luteolus TaxID=295089 RepID=A0A6I4UZN6_9SPHN|nr:hypothetical protein [Pontixanthobacter luteolus]MXP46020.1 hypothetical protein [Pontixanthobacter luteolus]
MARQSVSQPACVGTSARANLYADARGSIVMRTAHDGTSAQINTYDGSGAERA